MLGTVTRAAYDRFIGAGQKSNPVPDSQGNADVLHPWHGRIRIHPSPGQQIVTHKKGLNARGQNHRNHRLVSVDCNRSTDRKTGRPGGGRGTDRGHVPGAGGICVIDRQCSIEQSRDCHRDSARRRQVPALDQTQGQQRPAACDHLPVCAATGVPIYHLQIKAGARVDHCKISLMPRVNNQAIGTPHEACQKGEPHSQTRRRPHGQSVI